MKTRTGANHVISTFVAWKHGWPLYHQIVHLYTVQCLFLRGITHGGWCGGRPFTTSYWLLNIHTLFRWSVKSNDYHVKHIDRLKPMLVGLRLTYNSYYPSLLGQFLSTHPLSTLLQEMLLRNNQQVGIGYFYIVYLLTITEEKRFILRNTENDSMMTEHKISIYQVLILLFTNQS